MNRKVFHAAMGLILISCLVCPFVELAIGWNDTIFSSGYDTESLVAVVVLLFELALALASATVFLVVGSRKTEPLVVRHLVLVFGSGFDVLIPDDSPPIPLRI
jgi:hypothetical protein